jgi:hypothetical protein
MNIQESLRRNREHRGRHEAAVVGEDAERRRKGPQPLQRLGIAEPGGLEQSKAMRRCPHSDGNPAERSTPAGRPVRRRHDRDDLGCRITDERIEDRDGKHA